MAKLKKIKVDKKTKIVITIISLALVIMTILCLMLYKSTKQEELLKNEIYKVLNSDITSYSYDNTLKTTGNYGVIEKTIKQYISTYSKETAKIDAIKKDKTFTSILSADNYSSDGKDFNASTTYITDTQSTIDETLKSIKVMSEEKQLAKNIKSKKLSEYYTNLYNEIMLAPATITVFENAYKNTKVTADAIKNILSVQTEVLTLLKDNQDNWSVKDGKIVFNKTELCNSYNDLIKKIPK